MKFGVIQIDATLKIWLSQWEGGNHAYFLKVLINDE